MKSNSPRQIRGWMFDVYPQGLGEMAVWIISDHGERIRFIDNFQSKVYVSGKQEDLEHLVSKLAFKSNIDSLTFVYKYSDVTDFEKNRVLEVKMKDCRNVKDLTNEILKFGDYLRYRIHNCDLHGDREYLFSHDLFPLALLEVETTKLCLKYRILDSVENLHYTVPPLRVMKIKLEIAKKEKIAKPDDAIRCLHVIQSGEQITIDVADESEKLLTLSKIVAELDPDIILTEGGDSYIFSYLSQRAIVNEVSEKFVLSREPVPFVSKAAKGRTFFSYGRTFYKAPTTRLYGRIHIDETNTFVMNESSFEGLFEIARLCRVPLHTSSRSSIGSSMSSLQFCEAYKSDLLVPRNKCIPEAFKSARELLVGDRGGFVYEPKVGIHDNVGEVDFSSMYPSLMVKNNISAETVFCKCCPDSKIRIPELNYNICEKRVGIVPKSLKIVVDKRLQYKRLRDETKDANLREIYDRRQSALKWILVTCFGYLGYKNAKFGTVDGHIGVCAFGREAFLKTARIAENLGFEVIHGIVDSLWLKKEKTTLKEYYKLCCEASAKIGVPLSFEGCYKWIVFLPSKVHVKIGVLNRYYGVMESGKVKVRGLEVRKRDTPKFVYDAQMEMINVLSSARNSEEFDQKIPQAIRVVKVYRKKLLDGEIPIWDLMVTKHLTKNPKQYKQHVSQMIAAEQLIAVGSEVNAGSNVTFLFKDAGNKHFHRRVIAKQLLEKNVNADIKKYLFLLYSAAASLLSFKGYTAKTISDEVNGYSHQNLSKMFISKDATTLSLSETNARQQHQTI
jgi:DNA polymerase I